MNIFNKIFKKFQKSDFPIEVRIIDDILLHPNADMVEICIIGGWRCIVKKGLYNIGDKITYLPPDTVVPLKIAKELGIDKYTQHTSQGERIRQCNIRGEPSFGALAPALPEWEVGQDVADHFGAKKYELPVKNYHTNANKQYQGRPEIPEFPRYTDIDNIRNYSRVLKDGEVLRIAEKAHGSNLRVGKIKGEFHAGSRKVNRHMPEDWSSDMFWLPLTYDNIKQALNDLAKNGDSAVIYGELCGQQVQGKFHYNAFAKPKFYCFDIMINGKYLDTSDFDAITKQYNIDVATILGEVEYRGIDSIKHFADGQTTIGGADHIREGIVLRPLKERTDPRIGRVILKYVSDDYLLGKYHTEEDTQDY